MNKFLGLLIVGCTWVLPGCSYLEKMFPDKERDYQYTNEIPMINLPPELRRNQPQSTDSKYDLTSPNSTEGSSASTDSGASQNSEAPPIDASGGSSSSDSASNPEVNSTEVTTVDDSDEKDAVSSVQVVQYDDGESRLRLGAKHARSWRVVNKALSRNTIEVTERNHDQGHLKIQYDPDEVKAKDEGFMDEINFIWRGIGANDREFVLKLEEHGEQTDVIVLDDEFLPMLKDDDAIRLLKLLADTIKTDLAKKAKAETQSE